MSVELKWIEHAIVLARARSFARAAELLNTSQPSLSRSIATLEKFLGAKLFERGKREVVPTAFGRVLLERGEDLLTREAGLRQAIRELAGLEFGRVAIAAGPHPTEISVGAALSRVLKSHPGIRATVATTTPAEVEELVIAGKVDVGIASLGAAGPSRRIAFEPLAPHKLHFGCRPDHPLTRVSSLALEDILRFPLATAVLVGEHARAAESFLHLNTLEMRGGVAFPAVAVDSLALGRQLAQSSDVIVLGTKSVLESALWSGRLVRLDFHVPIMFVSYGILTLRGRSLSPAAEAFLSALRAVEAELAAAET